ncbi:hypothetical protein EDB86DRAFT_904742 [Lactarius hatsudake]|nr:hypothetical protein EDB86DRAFT_904742 [Lactarius hatsudake]
MFSPQASSYSVNLLRWYTSMLGKLSSLTALVSLLRAHSVRTGGSPLSFGKHASLKFAPSADNELCTHRARPGPYAPLGSRLVLHRRAPPGRKSHRTHVPDTSLSLFSPGCRTPKRARAPPPPPTANDVRQRLDRAPPVRAVKQVLGVLSGDPRPGK